MLTINQAHDIRKMYFEEEKNISEIARETGQGLLCPRNLLNTI